MSYRITSAQATAFDRLLSEKPELSYEDIAQLRNMCMDADRVRKDLAEQDRRIHAGEGKPAVMLKTADGLVCRYPGKIEIGQRWIRLRIRNQTFSLTCEFDPATVQKMDRVYEFVGFEGTDPRVAMFVEKI